MNKQDFNKVKIKLSEGVIDRLRYITDEKQATRVNFDNGETLEVDLFTASAIVSLYNSVNDQNKAKIEDNIGKSKEMFYKIADFAFSNIKESAYIGRGDILINENTDTVKMTESAYSAKPKSSRLTIKDQPYILINKPGVGESAYSVKFTKKHPILEEKEFQEGTRIHAGVGKKGGAGISGIVVKEENGYVFFQSDEGKNYKAPKEKVMPVSDFKFTTESKHINEKSVSKDQQRAAGAALAAKRGETPVSELQGASKEMYDSMTKKELEDFAGTKHSGLPEKVDEAKDYKAEKDRDGTYTIYTVDETGSRQDMVKDGLTKSQAKKMIDKLYSKDLGLIDEDGLGENAFNQAAADAAVAGKEEFEFNGKTYPVKMDRDTAEKLDDDIESPMDQQEVPMDQEETFKAMQDPGDYGPDAGAEMAETQIHYLVYAIGEIKDAMKAGYHMPDWLQNKISSAHQDMQGIHSYMEGSRRKREMCGPISEGHVGSDYGPDAASGMARTQLSFMKYAAEDVLKCISAGTPIPEWYQNKIAKVHRAIETIYSYIEGKRRSEDDDTELSMTADAVGVTPASQPAVGTGAMFASAEEDYIGESPKKRVRNIPPKLKESKKDKRMATSKISKFKRSRKLNESKKSDWNVDALVKKTMGSPLLSRTVGKDGKIASEKTEEELKQEILELRQEYETKFTKEVLLPINGALINLQERINRGNTNLISDSEQKFIKEVMKELRTVHDKIDNSTIVDPDV